MSTLTHHAFSVFPKQGTDPHATYLLNAAHALGFDEIQEMVCHACYFLQGDLTEAEKQLLADRLFCDPVAQAGTWELKNFSADVVIESALRPGVTDPISEHILRAAGVLGVHGLKQVASGQRFLLKTSKPLSEARTRDLTERVLVNSVIHHYALGHLHVNFPEAAQADATVEIIPLQKATPEQLKEISLDRRAALNDEEMLAVQKYFQKENRDPTDVEFEMIAQTWSEHCCHKTFRAKIQCDDGREVKGLLKTFIRAATEEINAPWVLSAFVDNAGIVELDDDYQIAFKVETHNHPSAIEPFGGANTGLGGVIRDVLGTSSKPIAATDIFCFGVSDISLEQLPAAVIHPTLIKNGVIAGVQDYGNKTGIPTVNGAVYYDKAYTANPLVFCGCVGLAPKGSHPTGAQAGDRVIVIGGRTGRDGLRGATFSSMTMDASTGLVAGASVQIGDPVIAKGLIEVVTRARDARLYSAITDCGAGGLSSAVGEMASQCGADVDIQSVPLKYSGLVPWEIWLSEAQERMVFAVPPKHLPALKKLCEDFDIELTDLGVFNNTKRLCVRYGDRVLVDLETDWLFEEIPTLTLKAEMPRVPVAQKMTASVTQNWETVLLELLAHPNIASKEAVIRCYDHEIQGATVLKPLVGLCNDGPSDACVLKPIVTKNKRGIVLSNGLNPEYGKYDPYRMACSAIDEAIRNAVAVGADPKRIAILDNFCWGNPRRPSTVGALVAACQGCYDAAIYYQTPFISGKDSLNNEYMGEDGVSHAIPPTLLISAMGVMPDVTHTVSMDFKQAGDRIYLLGTTEGVWGGSHLSMLHPEWKLLGEVPALPKDAPKRYETLFKAIQTDGMVTACHDISEGGLAVALAEMCLAGRLGCEIELPKTWDILNALFSEANGRFLVSVTSEKASAFEALFAGQSLVHLGEVKDQHLVVLQEKANVMKVPVSALVKAWSAM